ncbi:MAG: hypothetical protein K2M37_07415 [Muribaculaceae bacterium]|nr:hypothetical protein [Muribaculaceae bacterium]
METLGLRERLAYWLAAISLTLGFGLLFTGFFYPPEGEIDSSVIYIFGEILLFSGSLLGISFHYHGIRK